MTTNHPIIAAPWQLTHELGAIIVPLEPQPKLIKISPLEQRLYPFYRPYWKLGTITSWQDGIAPDLSALLPWKEGDRIYLQEKWGSRASFPGSEWPIEYSLASTQEPLQPYAYKPASTMPSEAAQYWFQVTSVRVVQMKNLTGTDAIEAGMPHFLPEEGGDYASLDELFLRWNAACLEQPWHGDQWVAVLSVQKAAAPDFLGCG